MTFRLNNKWPGEPARFDFTALPEPLWSAEGILPLPLSLHPAVGTETALLLFDRTDFIHQLAVTRPFQLMMKTGLVRTDYGPLMFILFWVPNPRNPTEPMTAIDCHLNPLDPESMTPWRDLARQSHWHLFLLDAENEQQGFFEFANTYNLGEALDQALQACAGMESVDFLLAKQEFCNIYDISTLLNA